MIMPAPLVLTMGDPAGIGPELAAQIWVRHGAGLPRFFMIADPNLMQQFCPVVEITAPDQAASAFDHGLPIIAERLISPAIPGQPTPENGPAIITAIRRAVEFTQTGQASAIVTNPIHKAGLYAAGFNFPGHTEFLGHLTGAVRPVMMLAVPGLRVVPATIHIPLHQVASDLSTDLLIETLTILDKALRQDFGIANPRIAVTGLNPHSGEAGTIGTEEQTIITPAITAAKARRINVRGPMPADSLFHEAARATYDAVLCQYHDQALIPLKMLDFFGGVNITLGLPIVRTSPDHGTAYDIAGSGRADPRSLIAALQQAADIAAHRGHSK
jgi:4-hydroxythreonine-4-phosphate dehydrogenase